MRPIYATLTLIMGISLLFCSCRNDMDELYLAHPDDGVAMSFRISPYQQVPFDNEPHGRAVDVGSVCKHLLLAIYQNDNLDTLLSQQQGSEGFGHFPILIERGVYRIVVLAHSSEKQPDMSDPHKVNFGSKNMSDVLYWSDEIAVGRDSVINVSLRRAVAKVVIRSTDSLPKQASQVYVRYDGSGTSFDATTGKGFKSFGYEYINIPKESVGKPLSTSVYIFPSSKDTVRLKEVQLQISNKNGSIIDFQKVNDVPIKTNSITRLTGRLHK